MKPLVKTGLLAGIVLLGSCIGFEQDDQPPEIESLQQGLSVSAAIGYCASIAFTVHSGSPLPENVTVGQSGLIHVNVDAGHPLPFNKGSQSILIASLWGENGGLMSVIFSGGSTSPGFYAIPIAEKPDRSHIRAFFFRQDIILGYASDTILNLSSALLDSRLNLLNTGDPENVFVAVKQNFWSVEADQNNTPSNIYDDELIINGGGQMAEVEGESGGVIYHAMIDTRVNYSVCARNPFDGFALSQNFRAGGEPLLDLGNSFLSFHSRCDGKAHIEFSTGKYLGYSGKDLDLGFE